MRVLIADDHEAIHFLAAHLVKQAFPDNLELHDAKSVDELLATLDKVAIDMVVLDLVMPGPVRRIGLIHAVRAHHRHPKILVYSGETHPPLVLAAMAAGAAGYVPKGSTMASLVLAMQAVANGDSYIDPSFKQASVAHPWQSLSVAERDVLRQIASGKSTKQIASDTDRAYSTIASLRTHGLEKLGLRSQEELSAYFYQNGLDFELDSGFNPELRELPPEALAEPLDGPRGKVVALRPGNLASQDQGDCETIALVMLGLEESEARKNMRVTNLTFKELEERYGRPDEVSRSNAWRFPAQRWSVDGFNLLAIDLGKRRVFYSAQRRRGRPLVRD